MELSKDYNKKIENFILLFKINLNYKRKEWSKTIPFA